MIPLPWVRIAAFAVAATAIAVVIWRLVAWHSAYDALPQVQAALEAEQVCGEGSKCAARVAALKATEAAISAGVVRDYENELQALRDRPPVTRVIRVCRQANPGDVSGTGPAGSADGTTAGTGIVSGSVEFDPRPLFELAREADELAARLRALQDWNRALAGP